MTHPAQLPEGTVIVEGVIGSIMAAVYYPYRRSPDAYIVPNEEPGKPSLIRCLQCDADIERDQDAWVAHIRSHDRRKRVQRLAREVGS